MQNILGARTSHLDENGTQSPWSVWLTWKQGLTLLSTNRMALARPLATYRGDLEILGYPVVFVIMTYFTSRGSQSCRKNLSAYISRDFSLLPGTEKRSPLSYLPEVAFLRLLVFPTFPVVCVSLPLDPQRTQPMVYQGIQYQGLCFYFILRDS